MPLIPWGATSFPYLMLPNRPLGSVLLPLYIFLLLVALVRMWPKLRQVSRRELFLTLSFCFFAAFASQLLLIELPAGSILPPIAVAETPVNILRLIGFVPVLLAALVLAPELVIFVGLASGLARGGWQTHQAFDMFHFALAGWVAAKWLRQNYIGWPYRLLRRPPVAGILSLVLVLPPLVWFSTYVYAPDSASFLAAIDLAFSTIGPQVVTAVLEGGISGVIVSLILWGVPQLHEPPAVLEPSPISLTLKRRLTFNFLLYSVVLIIVLPLFVSFMSVRVATDLVVGQMEQDALAVQDSIPDFLRSRENLLKTYEGDSRLLSDDEGAQQEALEQLFETLSLFRYVMLVEEMDGDEGAEYTVRGLYPADEDAAVVSNLERAAILRTEVFNGPVISDAENIQALDTRSNITVVMPMTAVAGEPRRFLLGRVSEFSMIELISELSAGAGDSEAFIVDGEGRIIAHRDPNSLLEPWNDSTLDQDRILFQSAETGGTAYEGLDGQSNTRQLVYASPEAERNWTVVVVTPYEVVLNLAWRTWGPIIGVLVAATLLFLPVLVLIGNRVSRSLGELLRASERIASGDYTTTLDIKSQDEVGRLGQAFTQMQRALRNRMDELSLLLDVSKDVSASLNVADGMPSILRAALRATGAAGARMVVINPNGRYPLTFGEGPANEHMSLYDRKIMGLLHANRELVLPEPDMVQSYLDLENLNPRELGFRSLIAFALFSQNRFHGVFWLVYRQPHIFEQTEMGLLRTLAGQASVLMANARLFAKSEGGRQRLLALLASTADPVIVTDPTNRVLLINPAMEKAFGLSTAEVKNRQIKDVLEDQGLIDLLHGRIDEDSVQVAVGERTFVANASDIVNRERQAQGRVAVLHDVTHMKELDDMKSNFVQMVSHDLRSPLTYMSGFMAMLPMVGELNDKQQEYVDKVQNGIDQLNTMVKNLLDLGRLEAGLDMMRSPLRLDSLLTSIAADMKPIAEENGVNLVVESSGKMPYLNLDNALVRQAIVNLVNNAIKYAPQSGEVVLRVEIKPSPNGNIPSEEVVVSICDNGPGIPEDELPRLFEKFHRVQQRDNIKVKGSGLGLAIVKLVAERHGGRAWVESELDAGSTFYIAFPNEPVDFALMG